MSLSIVAIIAARNEQDVIGQVIGDLIRQRIDVYLIDDGSTDATVERATPWLGRGLIEIERRPASDTFDWEGLLHRKVEVAGALGAAWCIHHDADELRESPWAGRDLRAAVEIVDALNFNAIDFRVINFRPVDDRFAEGMDLRSSFEFFEPAAEWDSLQIKAWKRPAGPVDLVSSGGHEAVFDDRRVFPIQFLTRHYPIRNSTQGSTRIFQHRLGRYSVHERTRGWHRQYDGVSKNGALVWPRASLQRFDADEIRDRLLAEPRAVIQERRARQQVAILQQRLVDERRVAQECVRSMSSTLDEMVETRARVRAELEAVYASKSWRMTGPLRRAYEMAGLAPRPGGQPVQTSPSPIAWGDLARLTPVSRFWGVDRGEPIDRHYITAFLSRHHDDIRGQVLEVKDPGYARRFGGDRVVTAHVLDADTTNPQATVVADLSSPSGIGVSDMDCFILTQTLHIVFDVRTALRNAVRALRPGGVLLCTLPAVSRVNPENGGLVDGDFWRFTAAAVRRLFDEVAEAGDTQIETFGNVQTCTAFLYGLAAEELAPDVLECHDPWFPLVHAVRTVRRP